MTWNANISGNTTGTREEQYEKEETVLANLRAVVEQLWAAEPLLSATVSTQHHGHVDLIGPRSPELFPAR